MFSGQYKKNKRLTVGPLEEHVDRSIKRTTAMTRFTSQFLGEVGLNDCLCNHPIIKAALVVNKTHMRFVKKV